MASELARVFQGMGQSQAQPGLPMLNSLHTSYSGYLAQVGQTSKKKKLMAWFRSIPELNALAMKVARDIVSKFHFEPIKPNDSNRNKMLRANKFAMETSLRKIMQAQIIDSLITGEGFGWLGKIKGSDSKEIIQQVARKHLIKNPKLSIKEKKEMFDGLKSFDILDTSFIDEEVRRPRKYRYVASSTMEVQHDDIDVYGYVQDVGGKKVKFSTDEIVHYKLVDYDGRINGFTPVESIVVQLELLRQMWQNQLSLHKNGGVPDHMFIFKNMHPSDPSFEKLKQQIQKYRLVENKHGNMVFTGDVSVESLQQLDKMQFMDQGLYITGLVAMQWQIPRSSIPYIVGGTNTKDDTGGNSERGYWDTVKNMQDIFADTMNSQLWVPYFGVRLVFDNQFVQKDVQEQTMWQLKLNNVQLMDQLLAKSKKKIAEDKLLSLLGLTSEDTEEYEMEMMNPVSTLNNQLSQDDQKPDNQQNIAKRKKDEQTATMASSGKPTGVGKEIMSQIELHPNDFLDQLIINYMKLHPGVTYEDAKKVCYNLLT